MRLKPSAGVGKGTLRLGEIGHESVFRAQATSGQQAEIAIQGDDIIINGTLVAQSQIQPSRFRQETESGFVRSGTPV